MQLIDIYKAILDFADCTVNEAGFIQIVGNDGNTNILVDGKDLVLPIDTQLRNPSPNSVIFHPLMENELGGEPLVVSRFRDMILLKLNKVTASLMQDLVSILNSPEIHKNLNDEAKTLLYQGIEVNAGTSKALSSIHKAEASNFTKMYISLWLRKGGQVRGNTFARAGIVSFPMYSKLEDEGYISNLPKGVRKNDPVAFRQLIKYIFPEVQTPGSYYEGSDSRVAPYFDALLKTAKTIASRLQTLLDVFQEHLVLASEYSFNGDWIESFNNLEALKGQIALIPNNPSPVEAAPVQPTVVNNSVSPMIATQQLQPSMNMQVMPPSVQSKPVSTGGRKSISELANASPQFGLNVMQASNQMNINNNMAAMHAMMTGNMTQGNQQVLQAMMLERQQAQERLINQLGPQGANYAMQLMAQGMPERSAVMKAMVEIPKQQQMFNIQTPMTVQQSPKGELVNINGKNYVRFDTPQGSQFMEVK